METTLKTNVITAEEALTISKTKSWLPEVFAAIKEAAEHGKTFTSCSELESHDKACLIELGYHVSSKAGITYINWREVAMDDERIKTVLERELDCTITRIHVSEYGNAWFNAIAKEDLFISSYHKGIEILEVKSISTGLSIYGCIEGKYLSKLYDDENRN